MSECVFKHNLDVAPKVIPARPEIVDLQHPTPEEVEAMLEWKRGVELARSAQTCRWRQELPDGVTDVEQAVPVTDADCPACT